MQEPRLRAFMRRLLVAWIDSEGKVVNLDRNLSYLLGFGHFDDRRQRFSNAVGKEWGAICKEPLPEPGSAFELPVDTSSGNQGTAGSCRMTRVVLPREYADSTLLIGGYGLSLEQVIGHLDPPNLAEGGAFRKELLFYIHDHLGKLLWASSVSGLDVSWPEAPLGSICNYFVGEDREKIKQMLELEILVNSYQARMLRQIPPEGADPETKDVEISVRSIPIAGRPHRHDDLIPRHLVVGNVRFLAQAEIDVRQGIYRQKMQSDVATLRYYPYFRPVGELSDDGVPPDLSERIEPGKSIPPDLSEGIEPVQRNAWPDFRLSFGNDALARLVGLSGKKDLDSRSPLSAVSIFDESYHSLMWKRAYERVRPQLLNQALPNVYATVVRSLDGADVRRLVRLHVFPVRDRGNTAFCEGVLTDLTDTLKRMMRGIVATRLRSKLSKLMNQQSEVSVLHVMFDFLRNWVGPSKLSFAIPAADTESQRDKMSRELKFYYRLSADPDAKIGTAVDKTLNAGLNALLGGLSPGAVQKQPDEVESSCGRMMAIHLPPPSSRWREPPSGSKFDATYISSLTTGFILYELSPLSADGEFGIDEEARKAIGAFEREERIQTGADSKGMREARDRIYGELLRQAKIAAIPRFAVDLAEIIDQTRARYVGTYVAEFRRILEQSAAPGDAARPILHWICHALRCDAGAIYLREGDTYRLQGEINLKWRADAEDYTVLEPDRAGYQEVTLLERALRKGEGYLADIEPEMKWLGSLTHRRKKWSQEGPGGDDFTRGGEDLKSVLIVPVRSAQPPRQPLGVVGLINKRVTASMGPGSDLVSSIPQAPFSAFDVLILEDLIGPIANVFEMARAKRETTRNLQIIGHEFGTPKTIISDASDTLTYALRKDSLKWLALEAVDDLEVVCGFLDAITGNLSILDLDNDLKSLAVKSESERENTKLFRGLVPALPTNIHRACQDALNFLVPCMRRQYSLDIEIAVPAIKFSPGSAILRGLFISEHLLKQVMFNLVTNAVKYRKQKGMHPKAGTVEITVQISVCLPEPGFPVPHYRIDFSDNGIGIHEQEQDRVLGEGVRSSRIVNDPGGKGYGLWLCRRVVDIYTGKLRVTNSKDPTTISFWLPEGLAKRNNVVSLLHHRIRG